MTWWGDIHVTHVQHRHVLRSFPFGTRRWEVVLLSDSLASITVSLYPRRCFIQLRQGTLVNSRRFLRNLHCFSIHKIFITAKFGKMAESVKNSEYVGHVAKKLTQEEIEKMQAQNSRLVSEFRANQLEKDAKKHWDLFYKRNDTRFFKDRHWTTREFHELLGLGTEDDQKILLEVGCGVGNFIYPLIEDGLKFKMIFACDLSPRAVELTKKHILYNPKNMKIFQTDITTENCFCEVDYSVNIVTLIFVLSAINPTNFRTVVKNLYNVLDIGGIVLFRDYGLYDMAQLRFKPGHKISENLYMRQDGTRTYYFSAEEVLNLFESIGFKVLSCSYVQRRTINLKEKIDVPRIFVQGKFGKF